MTTDNLYNLQKFIRQNCSTSAIKVAYNLKKISPEKMYNKLFMIMFEDIGLANISLLKEITELLLNDKSNYKLVIKQISQSYKSRLCSFLSCIFHEVFVYQENDIQNKNIEQLYEPIPSKQYEMIDFNNINYDIKESIKLAGAMFFKGMDSQFWELIYGDLIDTDKHFVNNMEKISQNIISQNQDISSIWIFAIIWKYLLMTNNSNIPILNIKEIDIKEIEDKIDIKEINKIDKIDIKIQRPENFYKSSNYFYVCRSDDDTNKTVIPDNLNISKSDKDKYCIKQLELGENMILSKYTIENILEFSSFRSKKILHLSDLGTIQIPYINKIGKKSYLLYCWLSSVSDPIVRRYVLKSYIMKDTALKVNEFDNMMNKYTYKYKWCFPSKVICIAELIEQAPSFIDNGRVVDKKCYYTIMPALPYFTPVNMDLLKYEKALIVNQVNLINIMKYIFGIPDRIAYNCGIYMVKINEEIKLQVCSFNHDPIMKELKCINLDNINIKDLELEKKWIFTIYKNFEKKYYTRICEVITSIIN